jgi:hypothetical protein
MYNTHGTRDIKGNNDVERLIKLKEQSKKWTVKVWAGFNHLRIQSSRVMV